MLEPVKKHRIEPVIITLTGPPGKKNKIINFAKKQGYLDTSDLVPWEEVFPDDNKEKECGEILAGIRYREDLTQKELAELTGISQAHISEMENGKRPITKNMALKFSKALNVGYKVFL